MQSTTETTQATPVVASSIGALHKASGSQQPGGELIVKDKDTLGTMCNGGAWTSIIFQSCNTVPNNLGQIPDLPHNLQSLTFRECYDLRNLPGSLSSLTGLAELDLSGCQSLRSLPKEVGQGCSSLVELILSDCASLKSLPELDANTKLRKLDLGGCGELKLLPASLERLTNLTHLRLSGCYNLAALPLSMSSMVNLKELKLKSCNGLKTLPQEMPKSLETLDLSYCSQVDSLAESLLELEGDLVFDPTSRQSTKQAQHMLPSQHQIGKRQKVCEITLRGWGGVLKDLEPYRVTPDGTSSAAIKTATFCLTPSFVQQLRHSTSVQPAERLLGDKQAIMELLSRLSWLGVLLASATFFGAIAPPAGFSNGMLFLDYSSADCYKHSSAGQPEAVAAAMEASYSSSSSSTQHSAGNQRGSIFGSADSSLGLDNDAGTCMLKPKSPLLHWFFVLDLLSFGFSMTLVMFVVACSIPRTGKHSPEETAGLIWLSLLLASLLLIAAVVCGMAALLSGLLAVYPAALVVDIETAGSVSLALMGLMFVLLIVRFAAVYPGSKVVKAALGVVCKEVVCKVLRLVFWPITFLKQLVHSCMLKASPSAQGLQEVGTNKDVQASNFPNTQGPGGVQQPIKKASSKVRSTAVVPVHVGAGDHH